MKHIKIINLKTFTPLMIIDLIERLGEIYGDEKVIKSFKEATYFYEKISKVNKKDD